MKTSKPTLPPPGAYRKAAATLRSWQKACVICPRRCGANRLAGERGFCRAGEKAVVNTAQLHFGEEPPISGSAGSGTVFFSGCTLACRFCQNHEISQSCRGEELNAEGLALVFMRLMLGGAHNLNMVTPTPHLPVILDALAIARENGCMLPVVYNTSGYERAAVIRRLAGLVDIYLPDYKYADDKAAARLSGADNYVRNCRESLAEMFRQAGGLELDGQGVALRGVLVRHLVLPNGLSGTEKVLPDLVRLGGPGVWLSLMSQYYPAHLSLETPGLERRINRREYQKALDAMEAAGIENGFAQELSSAEAEYFPGFKL